MLLLNSTDSTGKVLVAEDHFLCENAILNVFKLGITPSAEWVQGGLDLSIRNDVFNFSFAAVNITVHIA